MPLETAFAAYAGLANLALAHPRFTGRAEHRAKLPPRARALTGSLLLGLSIVLAFWRFGATQGAVAWLGLLSLAALTLVLLASRWPSPALGSWAVAALVSPVFLFV